MKNKKPKIRNYDLEISNIIDDALNENENGVGSWGAIQAVKVALLKILQDAYDLDRDDFERIVGALKKLKGIK